MPLFKTFESKDKPFNVCTILEPKKDSKDIFDIYILNLAEQLPNDAIIKIHKQILMFWWYQPAKDMVWIKTKYIDSTLIKNILHP